MLRYLLTLLIILVAYSEASRAQTIAWQHCYGGSDDESFSAIIATTDGGYAAVGNAQSRDGDVHGVRANFDAWLVKLTATGDTQWTKTMGGASDDSRWYSIAQTFDSGYILAGITKASDGDVHGNHGLNDAWIVKLSAKGDTIWTRCFGGSAHDFANAIIQTNDSGYVFTGSTQSKDGDVHRDRSHWSDYWIVKLNRSGDTQWTRCFGSDTGCSASSIVQLSDGSFIVAGYTNGDVPGFHGGVGLGWRDAWVVKLTPDGQTQWTKCYGGSYYEEAFAVTATSDGGFAFVGDASSTDGDVHGLHGAKQFDGWVVKCNGSGDTEWTKCLGGGGWFEEFDGIVQTSDGGFALAGSTDTQNDGDVHSNRGGYDGWVVKLNSVGDIEWTRCLGGTKNDGVVAVTQASDGGIVVAGGTPSIDGDVKGNHGNHDAWIVKVSKQDADATREAADGLIVSVFPNPVVRERECNIQLKCAKSGVAELSLFDEIGREIITRSTRLQMGESSCISVDLSSHPPGTYSYILRFYSDAGDVMTRTGSIVSVR